MLKVSISSKEGNSSHRLAHWNGELIPVVPTQYDMSTMRESSSSSEKSEMEMLVLEVGDARWRGFWRVIGLQVARLERVAIARLRIVGGRILSLVYYMFNK